MSVPATSTDYQETGVISRVPQRVFDRLFDPSLVTIVGLPPKDPNNDEEDEEDEQDEPDEQGATEALNLSTATGLLLRADDLIEQGGRALHRQSASAPCTRP